MFSGRRANFFTDRHTMLSMNCYIFCIVVMKIVRFLLKQIRSSATMSFKAGVVCSIFCHTRNYYLGCRFSFVTHSASFFCCGCRKNMHRVCFGNRCVAQGFFCNAFLLVCYGEALSAGPAVKYPLSNNFFYVHFKVNPFEYGVFHR